MTNEEFIAIAKNEVSHYFEEHIFGPAHPAISDDQVFVTWYAKVLQNHKALLGVDDLGNDQHYYEVTYNGDKGELYLDVYNKEENVCIKVNDNER
ncbi:hypothetical protein DKZ22_10700 [Limosilactobacillus reuteri]|uniref:Phage protein n=1 Tax=Limosilactobacillus reuteri TaxID=1598 RepID=A0A855XMK5_LIMRT|nr:DUF6275 family protein [Limosilactobacillus reuteri]PWT39576.1 hypothetical protein DKZ22_10700 [Limosilactobacillus reuteri]PWT68235.1 hypothetical protein DKZ26_10315 [Limosilactobacillus reuteri]